jgi:hypothetical protein
LYTAVPSINSFTESCFKKHSDLYIKKKMG